MTGHLNGPNVTFFTQVVFILECRKPGLPGMEFAKKKKKKEEKKKKWISNTCPYSFFINELNCLKISHLVHRTELRTAVSSWRGFYKVSIWLLKMTLSCNRKFPLQKEMFLQILNVLRQVWAYKLGTSYKYLNLKVQMEGLLCIWDMER